MHVRDASIYWYNPRIYCYSAIFLQIQSNNTICLYLMALQWIYSVHPRSVCVKNEDEEDGKLELVAHLVRSVKKKDG